MTRVCSDCPAPISAGNRTGRCRSCAAKHKNADPVARARQSQGLTAFYDRPGVRDAYGARLRERNRNLSPEAMERRREHGRVVLGRYNNSPELRARLNDPVMKAANGRKRSDTVLAWCPSEWRDRYRELKKRGRRAPIARRMVLAEIEAARQRTIDADAAATFLARYAPVYRCDERGRLDRTAGYWRFGSAVLTRAEVIARACRKGYAPDRLAA